MRLLIDSHVALWWLAYDTALGTSSRESIRSADEVFFSPVTPWELGIKQALGKLSMPDNLIKQLIQGGFKELPITAEHARAAATLTLHHHDPFDRMLIAQARVESLILVTADRQLDAHELDLMDARS